MPVLRPTLILPTILFLPPRRVGDSVARGGGTAAGGVGVAPTVQRPPRRKMADMGVMGQMVCDAGNSGTQFTPVTLPRPGLDGEFAPLDALLRRVAGVSWL